MKNLLLLVLLVGSACGGQVTSSADAGQTGTQNEGGQSAGEGGATPDANVTTNDANAPVSCPNASNTTCVFCSDDKWHCGDGVFDACPTNAKPGGSCDLGTGKECVTCNGNSGYTMSCPNGAWFGFPTPCAQ